MMPSSCASVAPALWKTRPSASSSTPGTPMREEMGQRLRHRGLQRLDRHAQPAGAGENRRRVDAEGEAELGRIDAALAQKRHQPVDHGAAAGMHVDADAGRG